MDFIEILKLIKSFIELILKDILIIIFTLLLIYLLSNTGILLDEALRDAFIFALGIEIAKLVWKINKNYFSTFQPAFIYNFRVKKRVEKRHKEGNKIKRNEELIQKVFQKILSDDHDTKYLGIREIIQWSKQNNLDKCKISNELINIIAKEEDNYFKKVLIEVLCSDYRKYLDPGVHEASPTNKMNTECPKQDLLSSSETTENTSSNAFHS
jgi:hypothetical protein